MYSSVFEPGLAGDISSKFWSPETASISVKFQTAHNLYELFVQELAALISGACQACRVAEAFSTSLPPNQIVLQRLARQLCSSSRACLPRLPSTIRSEGIILSPVHNAAVEALLSLMYIETTVPNTPPRTVMGAHVASVFHKIALYMHVQSTDAAENAHLLGSEPLRSVLGDWSSVWSRYIDEIQSCRTAFRAQAFVAGCNDDFERMEGKSDIHPSVTK